MAHDFKHFEGVIHHKIRDVVLELRGIELHNSCFLDIPFGKGLSHVWALVLLGWTHDVIVSEEKQGIHEGDYRASINLFDVSFSHKLLHGFT